jgi:hypothetical protein
MSQPATQPPSQPPARARKEWDASASLSLLPTSVADIQAMFLSANAAPPAPAPAPKAAKAPAAKRAKEDAKLLSPLHTRTGRGGPRATTPTPAAEASDYEEAEAEAPRGPRAVLGLSLADDEPGARAAPLPAKRPRPKAPVWGDEDDAADEAAEAAARERARKTAARAAAAADDEDEDEVDTACAKCGSTESGDGSAAMLLCDGFYCDVGMHVACCKLKGVPSGSWFCADCEKMRQDGVRESTLQTLPLRTLRGMFEAFTGVPTASGNSEWLRRRLLLGLRGAAAAAKPAGRKGGRRMQLGVPGVAGTPRAARRGGDDDDDEFDEDAADGTPEEEEDAEEALDELADAEFIVPSPPGSEPGSEPELDDLPKSGRKSRGAEDDDDDEADEIEEDEDDGPRPVSAKKVVAKKRATPPEPEPAKAAAKAAPKAKAPAAKAAAKEKENDAPAPAVKKATLELQKAGKGSKKAPPQPEKRAGRSAKPAEPEPRRTRQRK